MRVEDTVSVAGKPIAVSFSTAVIHRPTLRLHKWSTVVNVGRLLKQHAVPFFVI